MLKKIVDTNTICSAIKDFYRNQLSEPILTYRLMPQFIQVCLTGVILNSLLISGVRKQRPQPNQRTLPRSAS